MVKDFLAHIIYMMPGYFAVYFFRLAYPEKEKHHFHTIAWALFLGLLVNMTMGELTNNRVLHISEEPLPDLKVFLYLNLLGSLLGFTTALFYGLRIRVGTMIINEKLVGKKVSNFLLKHFPSIYPDMGTIWHRINLPNESKWAIVYCLDGATYFGRVTHMSKNPEVNDQDFFLEDAERLDENRCFLYDCGEGVYFNLKNISRVEFVEGQQEEDSQACSNDASNIWYPERSPVDEVLINLIRQSTQFNDKSL